MTSSEPSDGMIAEYAGTSYSNLEELDECTASLIAACELYGQDPANSDADDSLDEASTVMIETFVSCAKRLYEAGDEQTLRDIAGMEHMLEESRIKGIKTVAPKVKLRAIAKEVILEDVLSSHRDAEGSIEDFFKDITDSFSALVYGDIHLFKKYVRKEFKKFQLANIVLTVATTPTPSPNDQAEPGAYYAFGVSQIKKAFSPDFIPDTRIDYQAGKITYGRAWVSDDVGQERPAEERRDAVLIHLTERFARALNPLGHMTMEVVWNPTDDDSDSSDGTDA